MTFEAFLAGELDSLRRYARLLTGDRDAAHDVVADALVKAHVRWNKIGPDAVSGGLRAVDGDQRIPVQEAQWSERFISSTHSGELPERAVPAAARSVDDRDQLEQLLRALPQQQRAAIVLRYYFDLTDEAIAAELRCSVGAVRSYVSRGLRAIRDRENEPGSGQEALLTPPPRVGRANPVGETR